MPDLIVLCAGALLAPATAAAAATAIAPLLPRAVQRATTVSVHDDAALVPTELPHEAWLRAALSLDPQWSVEAASAYRDGQAPAGEPMLRATPVHLHVGLDHLVLTDPQQLQLSADDAAQLTAAVAPLFADAGLALVAPDAMRWYLRGRTLPDWQARSWRMAVGRPIDVYSPQGPDARKWRGLVNEAQMTWFDHPVNQRREAAGLPAVNSLWLDGRVPAPAQPGGDLGARGRLGSSSSTSSVASASGSPSSGSPSSGSPSSGSPSSGSPSSGSPSSGSSSSSSSLLSHAAAPFATVVTDDPALAGLAKAAGATACVGLAEAVASLAGAPSDRRDQLLMLDGWQQADHERDATAWKQAWQRLAELLTTIGAADGPPAGRRALRIVLCGERRRVELRTTGAARWQPWKRADAARWLETRQ